MKTLKNAVILTGKGMKVAWKKISVKFASYPALGKGATIPEKRQNTRMQGRKRHRACKLLYLTVRADFIVTQKYGSFIVCIPGHK